MRPKEPYEEKLERAMLIIALKETAEQLGWLNRPKPLASTNVVLDKTKRVLDQVAGVRLMNLYDVWYSPKTNSLMLIGNRDYTWHDRLAEEHYFYIGIL